MGLANITLAWMIAQLRSVVGFDPETVCDLTTGAMNLRQVVNVRQTTGARGDVEFRIDMPVKEFKERVGLVGGSNIRTLGR
ncbi:hypothetical protein LTR24_010286 [Lithohypha guttulata]|uniref:Uncharacterized protein n=1 Tax=Lithohypha guttulata TaxID=1690604 RepID=A0ABR0JW57_9EURO|nr:hypothetical protein LTR24_010286 [Lithohypha guttulata]